MILDNDRPIPPLTRRLLPKVPWYLRWFGSLNNRWNESVVDAVLATRDDVAVVEAWRPIIPDSTVVERILAAIGKEMEWKMPRFVPQDECFVVMKLWWHGIADSLERERCLWALERVCKKKPPSSILPKVIDMTLGEFLEQFQETCHE